MGIGTRIREARKEKGWSQVEFAKKIGISKELLYRYETEKIENIPLERFNLIAKLLGKDPMELTGWYKPNQNAFSKMEIFFQTEADQKELSPIIDAVMDLDSEDRKEVLNYINFKLSEAKYKKVQNKGGEVG